MVVVVAAAVVLHPTAQGQMFTDPPLVRFQSHQHLVELDIGVALEIPILRGQDRDLRLQRDGVVGIGTRIPGTGVAVSVTTVMLVEANLAAEVELGDITEKS